MEMTTGGALRRRRGLVLTVFLIVVGAAVAAALLSGTRYTSTATLYVQPATSASQSSTVGDVAFVMPALEAYVGANPTRDEVEQQLAGDTATAAWTVDGESEPGTGLLRIAVTSRSEAVPPEVVDAYTPLVDSYAASLSTPVTVSVIEPAGEPSSDAVVRIASFLTAGLLLGVIVSVALALLVDRARPQR